MSKSNNESISLEELIKAIDDFKPNFIWKMYYWRIVPFAKKIKRTPKNIRWGWQRYKRGWSERDSWDAHAHISNVTCGMLTRIKERGISHPYGITPNEWDIILDKIIFAFKNIDDLEKSDEDEERIREGFELFTTYYLALWD